jgi:exosortase/archaeosortase family protein
MNPGLRFAAIFCGVSAALFAVYLQPLEGGWGRQVTAAYLHAYAGVTAATLAIFEPGVRAEGVFVNGRSSMAIARGCDGADVLILFAAAVCATRASWRRRAVGLLAGSALLTCANVARLCSLYVVNLRRPAWLVPIHHEVWPPIMLAIAAAAYALWLRRVAR